METFTKEQAFQVIINAIRFTERHYSDKVEIINEEGRLIVYESEDSLTFHNCSIINLVKAMNANCYMKYDEKMKRLVLVIF